MTLTRDTIQQEDRWNVESLFPSMSAWEEAFKQIRPSNEKPVFPKLVALQGKLHEGPSIVKDALEQIHSIDRAITKLYVYAHLRHDEDIAAEESKQAYNRALSLFHEFGQECAWFEPELLSLSDEKIQNLLQSEELAPYQFHLEKILRLKPHTLTPDQEKLMALSQQALSTASKTFSALNDADFFFGTAEDQTGKSHELTHASYGIFLRKQDRTLRKNAFLAMQGTYKAHQNTLAELLNGQVQTHLFNSRSRGYASCLEAALFPKNVELDVYHALINAVTDKIGALHSYIALREKKLNTGRLHLYDMYVPLTSEAEITMPYSEAEDAVIESVAPLGSEYQNILRKGLKDGRWVDRYENLNKRSGAYSSGCYDSMPYILMNYKELLRDVFTLAHEAGHSMHSYLSNNNQPYHYANYPIFLAEVASTFNEALLTRLLLERANSKEEKIFLINQQVEDIRATLFRQTMFAEFELFIHTSGENHIPITPALLNEKFTELNKKYFGNSVVIDPEAEVEWARIPHFYYNFYVYQYATGISAALALVERVLKGGNAERDDYLSFLRSGCSKYPIDTLKLAGVDMCSKDPVNSAIDKFSNLVNELASMLTDC